MKSHASATSQPPPSAKPFTAAIHGLLLRSIAMPSRPPCSANACACAGSSVCISEMSAPATNAFSPAPVSATTRTRASPSSISTAAVSSRITVPDSALSCGSRLMITTARGPSTPLFRVSNVISSLPARRTRRSRAASCDRASRPRRTGGAADTGGTCRRPAREAGIEAEQIRELERAHRRVEAELHAGIDVVRGAEPLVEAVAGFIEERNEHAVDDEAGDVARADHGLAEALRELGDGLGSRVARRQPADALDELHQRRRIHEVPADHAIGARTGRPELGD